MIKIDMEKDHMEKIYSSKNPLVRYIHTSRLNKIIKEIPKIKNLKILDAGCGEGHFLFKISKIFNEAKLYGSDITPIALESAEKRVEKVKFTLENLNNLNYEDDFFDIIICTEVIEHILDYEKVLGELKRVLKKGLVSERSTHP